MALWQERNSICFVLESFFPSHRAGTEVYVLNLCRYFKKQGWDVSVLIANTEGQDDYIFEGITVNTFQVPKAPLSKELNGIMPPRGLLNFKIKLKSIQPDWVHFHSLGRAINGFHIEVTKAMGFKTALTPHLGSQFCIKGNMRLFNQVNCDGQVLEHRCMACMLQDKGYATAVAKFLGAGISGLTHIKPIQDKLPPALFQAQHRKAELQRIKTHTDVIFAIAPWIQKAFETNNIKNSIVLPQGISQLFFKQSKETHKPVEWPIQFIFIGRMHSSKGFHLLKQAWEYLNEPEKVHLHVITNPSGGEIAYFNKHKTWAIQQTNVTWNEALTQEEVANYINSMDVLILPSISNEVAPLVILEAATQKIPTLASDYIAMKDRLKHGTDGWLFENGNAEALQNVLEILINRPESILEVAANIQKPHGSDEVAQLIEQELLNV